MFRIRELREFRATWLGDFVLVCFLLAQVLDGALTYVGTLRFGIGMEGNPLLHWLMLAIGEGAALACAKGTAIACGALLHLVEVHRIVAVLTAMYFALAVGPWCYILLAWGS
ncbi:MAG: hypothetical protein KJ061_05815 [Vicinamibacteraceae bacterium]|nr:hypothetical protein [Vicinamibacteraceae bacterium]